jgi:phage host-nuclease inhibitor protein Gam
MDLSPRGIRKAVTETNRLIGELGKVRRQRTVIEARMNGKIQRIKNEEEPKIKALQEHEAALVEQLLDLVLPRYEFLRHGKTKTIKLANGTISLRRNKVAVEVTDDDVDAVIRRIQRRGLTRKFLRRGKFTINKTALAASPDAVARIKGIQLVNKSTLTIAPSKVDVEPLKRDVDSVKVVLPEEEQQD